MSLPLLLEDLAACRIELSLMEGKLRYKAPEGALTPELRNRLSALKEQLLAHLSGRELPEPALRRIPAAKTQEKLWFFDQIQGPNCTYNIPFGLQLRGNLDKQALEAAVNDLVRRHESLRCAFLHDGESLKMEILRDIPAPWSEQDFSHSPAPQQAALLRTCVKEISLHCFDLKTAPLFLCSLIRLAPTEHLLVLNVHHIAADGWSFGIIMEELAACYKARAQKLEPSLPGLKWQYSDYIEWLQRQEQKGAVEADLAYWLHRLKEAPETTTIPPDFQRPAVQAFSGLSETMDVDTAVTTRLRVRAREWGATLNHLTMAATIVLLARHSGSLDLVIGQPLANRSRSELESIIGMFVNVMPLRFSLSEGMALRDVVRLVIQVSTEAMEHCNLPFERLIKVLGLKRDLSKNPLFQVGYNYLPPMEGHPSFGDLQVDTPDILPEFKISKYDITFYLDEQEGGLSGHVEFANSLYRRTTAQSWVKTFHEVLIDMLEKPDAPLQLSQRPAAADPGADQQEEWYAGPVLPLPPESPWTRFMSVAMSQPYVAAVEDAGVVTSYAELARRAEIISARLLEQGIAKGARVGLLLPRGCDVLAAMLGVVRCGAVFVPFDLTQPRQRLVKMTAKAQLGALLCAPQCSLALGLAPVIVEVGPSLWTHSKPLPAEILISHEDPLYMIFTSGSTGEPKAVNVPWRGLCNVVQYYMRMLQSVPGERSSQISSLSFDASLFEIWPVLLSGGTLVVVPEELKLDPKALRDWILNERISIHFSPTPLAEELLSLKWPDQSTLRILQTGGQALHRHPSTEIPFKVSNNYGPTEISIAATCCLLEPSQDDTRPPSIGHVIDNTRILILDEKGNRAPVGSPGELYISGRGVALGYFNAPDETARSFLKLPGEGETLWYRTGDTVRMQQDGLLSFVGRLDGQIKLRGHRIELGEIENALMRIPGIHQAAVRLEIDVLAAYVEADEGEITTTQIRRQLAEALPGHMVPAHLAIVTKLPRQSSGKIDLKALPFLKPATQAEPALAEPVKSGSSLEDAITAAWRKVLKLPSAGLNENFFDLGGHSMLLMSLKEQIKAETGCEISVLDLFKNPTITRQAAFIGKRTQATRPARNEPGQAPTDGGIAIIGMSGRFPDADNIGMFWKNLCEGRDSITLFSREELLAAGLPASLIDRPDYVPANGILPGIDRFDAGFFGVSAREAEVMDPQQRFLLEESWHAFEDAGYDPAAIQDRVGVFVGSSMNGYLIENVLPHQDIMESLGGFAVMIANDKDFAATRISYKLGLRGPSLSINTACSTSLVAIHQAVTALRDGQCEMALAGGACVRSRQIDGYLYEEGGVLSKDGKCRAFDASSSGMVGGNGVSLVLLKPLEAARAAGDHIYAVIKGIAVNNDGSNKVGFTAPSVQGQSLAIRDALTRAKVEPETVLYAETHGTATQLGDSIEMAALMENYAVDKPRTHPLLLGSVKTNIGHVDAAAGAAGLIKTCLCLHHHTLVPSLHFTTRNPNIQWPAEQFSVSVRKANWVSAQGPLRASVSSFGIGGTNAHAILEQAPERTSGTEAQDKDLTLLLVSGKTSTALAANAKALSSWLAEHGAARLQDVGHTLAFGRRHWEHRRALCVLSPDEAAKALSEATQAVEHADSVGFMFTGMGTQKPGMGRALYSRSPVFKTCIDTCADLLQPVLELDIRTLLLSEPDDDSSNTLLNVHRIGQPCVFAMEYGLAQVWIDLGLSPSLLIGHSLGEWVAACVAGVFSLPDALRLVSLRGGLMDSQPKGSMLAVNLAETQLAALLPPDLEIATINALDQVVVAGRAEAIEALASRLDAMGIRCKRLQVSLAAHSSLMEPALDQMRSLVAAVARSAPNRSMKIVSNLTGRLIDSTQLQDPDYWAEHMRRCVRFADGLGTLWSHQGLALLECGPSHTLCNLALRDPRRPGARIVVASSDGEDEPSLEWRRLLESAGALWAAGLPINLEKLFALQPKGARIPLPGYAFQRSSYWLSAIKAEQTAIPCPTPKHEDPEPAPLSIQEPVSIEEQCVINHMKELLGNVRLGRNTDFFLSGGDSLMSCRLASRLGETCGLTLSNAQIMKGRTPARIASFLKKDEGSLLAGDSSNGCLVLLAKGDDKLPPIILIHAVGGGAFIYKDLLQALSSQHPVYGLQATGLWDDEAPIDGLQKQAEHYHACLLKAGLQRPVMIGGSSYGGLICYELDRLYQQTGHKTALTVLFDSPGPGYLPRRIESDAEICAYACFREEDHSDFSANQRLMESLGHQGRIDKLLENIRSDWMPQATSTDIERMLRIFRQNLKNMWAWKPQSHQARLLYFKATEQSVLLAKDHEQAWVPMAPEGIEIIACPGNHTSMLSAPNVDFLANELNRRLSACPIDA